MITVTVTSDSNLNDLRLARIVLDELTARLEVNMFDEAKEFKAPETFENKAEFITAEMIKAYAIATELPIHEAKHELNNGGSVHIDDNDYVTAITPSGKTFLARPSQNEVFNTTELQEAETMGKPVCSTVDASQSTTAHVDTTDNTSLPAPTSVFGQLAQTTVNEANPVAQTTDSPVRDADGLVWDARIHSSSKELNKDGTWRKRRGVADELVRSVETELRGVAPTPEAHISHPPAPPPAPEVPKPIEVPPTVGDMSFTELLDGVTKAMVSGQLSQDKINEALATIGLTALPHLLGNPALIPAFREALGGVV